MFSAAFLIEFVAQNLYGKFAKTEKKSTSEATKPEVVAQTEKTSTSEAKKPEVVAVCGLRNLHFSKQNFHGLHIDCTIFIHSFDSKLLAFCVQVTQVSSPPEFVPYRASATSSFVLFWTGIPMANVPVD